MRGWGGGGATALIDCTCTLIIFTVHSLCTTNVSIIQRVLFVQIIILKRIVHIELFLGEGTHHTYMLDHVVMLIISRMKGNGFY